MKYLALCVSALGILFAGSVAADTYVDGYSRSDGSQVQGHYRSDRNDTVRDNYSYKGNTNPHTGRTGDNYYQNSPSSEYYGTKSDSKQNSYGW